MRNINPKKLLLIDAIGAILSSTIINLGIFCFNDLVEMPKKTMVVLAIIPVLYFLYSIINYFSGNNNEKLSRQLKVIAYANFGYCLLTLTIILFYWSKLTALELTYFSLEIIVLIILSIIELEIAKNPKN